MDLSKYDTTEKANKGVFLHLAFGGESLRMEGGDEIGLMVKGSTSTDFKNRLKGIQKARTERLRLKKNGRVKGLEGSDIEQRELYASAVSEYVNILVDGDDWGVAPVTIARTVELFDRFGWIEDQVIEFVDDDENYLGES